MKYILYTYRTRMFQDKPLMHLKQVGPVHRVS